MCRGEGSRQFTCVCARMCVFWGLTGTVWEPHLCTRGSLEGERGDGQGASATHSPCYPRIFRMPPLGPAAFSSPNTHMAPRAFPSPQAPSHLSQCTLSHL